MALLICTFTAMQGAVPQTRGGSDSAILYDAGWRAYCGMRPHADFYSSLGPFMYLYAGTGFWLFGVNVHVIAYMNAISFCLLTGLIWYLLRDRLSPFWLFWLAMLIAVCFIAPWSLRLPKHLSSYATLYNRQGSGLLMLFCSLLFCPAVKIPEFRWKLTSIVLGCLLPMMFFLKISLFIAAAPAFIVAYLIEVRKWLYHLYFAVAAAMVSVLFLAYIRFDVLGMMSDLSITAKAKSIYMNELFPYFVSTGVDMLLPILTCLIILFAGTTAVTRDPQSKLHFGWRGFMEECTVCILLLGVFCFTVFTNAIWGYASDYPGFIMLAIVMCARFQHRLDKDKDVDEYKRPLAFQLTSGLASVFSLFYIMTITYYTVNYINPVAQPVAFEAPALKGLVFDKAFSPHSMVYNTNDGIRLLQKNHVDNKPFMVMEFASYVHLAMGARPYRGTTFIDYGINI
ncbi:MAG TPA: hypothetical protein VK970_14750, partial [Candidatus Methylacidiphilales bacterium]|nr:hypothetical protein [Candidatus Methylacidiphilales bacterium]